MDGAFRSSAKEIWEELGTNPDLYDKVITYVNGLSKGWWRKLSKNGMSHVRTGEETAIKDLIRGNRGVDALAPRRIMRERKNGDWKM
jgi:hypothetical protein